MSENQTTLRNMKSIQAEVSLGQLKFLGGMFLRRRRVRFVVRVTTSRRQLDAVGCIEPCWKRCRMFREASGQR